MTRFFSVIAFEGLGPCYYRLGDLRPPKRGEHYLGSDLTHAYLAADDGMTFAFRIVVPTFHAIRDITVGWARGEPIPPWTDVERGQDN